LGFPFYFKMIIGNGDIGGMLNDREGFVFFASGVSNSRETKEKEFTRERNLLLVQPRAFTLVYFSSIGVLLDDPKYDTPYFRHKIEMEELVKRLFINYCIIRIGNIDWGDNPNTFINAIRETKKQGVAVDYRNELKYVSSRENLLLITDNIPRKGRNEICIFGKIGQPKVFI